MESSGKFQFSFKPSGAVQTLMGMLTVAGLIWVTGFVVDEEGWIGDPAGDAEAAFSLIQAQIEADESDSPRGPGRGIVLAASGATERPSLNRDLFSVDQGVQKGVEERSKKRKRAVKRAPRLPVLSAVLIDGRRRTAVLSGEVASAGDIIQSFTVLEVGRDSVILERRGKRYTLTMESN